jgi:hypothetical protein
MDRALSGWLLKKGGRRPARWWLGVWAMIGGLGGPPALSAQAQFGTSEVFVNSEAENYLRSLQRLGEVPLYPWSIRAFTPVEIRRLTVEAEAHPWNARLREPAPGRAASFRWVEPELRMAYNSAFPYQRANGTVWMGQGATSAVRAGFSVEAGPVFLTLAPEAYWAQNGEFPLAPETLEYRNWWHPQTVDLPQRFGDRPHTRIDPGQSTLGVQGFGGVVGISTAHQHWGPGREMPLLLGTNAPGFLHMFLGTSRPVNVGIGSIHSRVLWGRLEQSLYSPMPADSAHRLLSGIVGAFSPRGLPGLEFGFGRFIHEPWPSAFGGEHLVRMFGGVFAENTDNTVANQLASAYFRWVFPGSGFELYGEHVREDFSYNLRDFWLNPDLNAANMLGFQKSWRRSATRHLVLRTEVVSGRYAHESPLGFVIPVYVHAEMRQGHTHRGQLLGSPAAFGGAGMVLATDLYHSRGRFTLHWERLLRNGSNPPWEQQVSERLRPDVLHAFGAEALIFQGRWSVIGGLGGAYNFNRHYEGDVFNLHGTLGVRAGL